MGRNLSTFAEPFSRILHSREQRMFPAHAVIRFAIRLPLVSQTFSGREPREPLPSRRATPPDTSCLPLWSGARRSPYEILQEHAETVDWSPGVQARYRAGIWLAHRSYSGIW